MGIVCRQISEMAVFVLGRSDINVQPINPIKLGPGFTNNLSFKPIIFINPPRATAF